MFKPTMRTARNDTQKFPSRKGHNAKQSKNEIISSELTDPGRTVSLALRDYIALANPNAEYNFVLLKVTTSPTPNLRTRGPGTGLADHLLLPHEPTHPLTYYERRYYVQRKETCPTVIPRICAFGKQILIG